jgi:signal peptidase I
MDDPGEGTIPESAVLGRAFVVVWPPSQWKFLNIPATFGQPKLAAALTVVSTPLTYGLSSPLVLGFAGAFPVTALEVALRRRLSSRRRAARKRR